jgi:uncharacterized membrane protein YfcA
MNETTTVLTVLTLGFIAGILSGMFGIGGGLVIVPALVILFAMPIKTATGTSLFALMWPVGLLGVVAYWKSGHMNAWYGLWIAVGLFLGAYLGAKITLAITPSAMKRCYAVFLLAVGIYFLTTSASSSPPAEPEKVAAGDGQVH